MIRVSFLAAALAAGAALAGPARAAEFPPSDARVFASSLISARDFSGCSWTLGGDVGPCVQAAINFAAARGGGTVLLPAGRFGWRTPLVNSFSGVKLQGAGIGDPRDRLSLTPAPITALVWNGGAAALGYDLEPASNAVPDLTDAGIDGVVFDGAGLLTTVARIASISHSHFLVEVLHRGAIGFDLSANTNANTRGAQYNTGSFYEVSTAAASTSVGILFRKDVGSPGDWSYDTFDNLYVNGNDGTPMLFVNGDRVTVQQCTAFGPRPAVVANSSVVLPNGLATATQSWRNVLIVANGCPLEIQGLQSGATLAPGAVAGTAGPTTIAVSATATAKSINPLNVVSAAGIQPGETLNLTGGYAAGITDNAVILTSNAVANTITLTGPTTAAVAQSGNVAGVVSWGFQPGASANCVYTIRYNGATYDLTGLAPGAVACGIAQSGVSPVSGALTFTDIVIPWTTGAPVNGDTWVATPPVTVPSNINIYANDNGIAGNAIPYPRYESNIDKAGGMFGGNGTAPAAFNAGNQGVIVGPQTAFASGFASGAFAGSQTLASGKRAVVIGGVSGIASGQDSATIGGQSASCAALGSVCLAGNNNILENTANYSFVLGGKSNDVAGPLSGALGGSNGTDRGRKNCTFTGAGQINTSSGDAQTSGCVMQGFGSSAAVIRATADGAAASAVVGIKNCDNITDNTGYAFSAVMFARDHTSPSPPKWFAATWGVTAAPHVITRGVGASTVLIDGSASAIAPDGTPRTGGGVTVSATLAADTTNGCLNASFTPPAGNTDQWIVTFRVTQLESQ